MHARARAMPTADFLCNIETNDTRDELGAAAEGRGAGRDALQGYSHTPRLSKEVLLAVALATRTWSRR